MFSLDDIPELDVDICVMIENMNESEVKYYVRGKFIEEKELKYQHKLNYDSKILIHLCHRHVWMTFISRIMTERFSFISVIVMCG